MPISIKTPEELEKMRIAGQLAAEVLEMIEPYVKAGITTNELNAICHDYITQTQKLFQRHLTIMASPNRFALRLITLFVTAFPTTKN